MFGFPPLGICDTSLLERIIDNVDAPENPKYWSDAEETKFKELLTKVKVKAVIVDRRLGIRPEAPGDFLKKCEANGLEHCEYARAIIKIWCDTKEPLFYEYEIPPHSPAGDPIPRPNESLSPSS